MTRFCALLCFVALLGWMLGCAPQPAPDTRAADEKTIREVEAAWSKAVTAKDLEANLSFYAEDASVFAPNAPIVTGKEAIRAADKGLFADPGFSLSFQTSKVEVARSGDLAYTYGTYSFSMTGPKGKPVTDKGKFVTVYKKQPDGAWKCAIDIFNSDVPLPPPPKK